MKTSNEPIISVETKGDKVSASWDFSLYEHPDEPLAWSEIRQRNQRAEQLENEKQINKKDS